jgi:hypothetical protein
MAQGHKTGGRQKGTPNRRILPLREKANELGVDPFEVLLRFAKGDWEGLGYHEEKEVVGYSQSGDAIEDYTITPETRMQAAKSACEYLYPKLKAVEHSGPDGSDLPAAVIIYKTEWGSAVETDDDEDADEGT